MRGQFVVSAVLGVIAVATTMVVSGAVDHRVLSSLLVKMSEINSRMMAVALIGGIAFILLVWWLLHKIRDKRIQHSRIVTEEIHLESNKTSARREIAKKPPEISWEEAALLATVNRWWEDEQLDRSSLQVLLGRIGLPARFYAMKDIAQTLVRFDCFFTFEESGDQGGWLWFQQPGGSEALVVPADPMFFSTGPVMTLVKRMFEGFDTVPARVRFVRAYRACRLRVVPGENVKYTLVALGNLRLHGSSISSNIPAPLSYEALLAQPRPARPPKP